MNLFITYTRHSELQGIRAIPLFSTFNQSPQHPLSLFQRAESSPAVLWQQLLTVGILLLHAFWSSSQPPLQKSCQLNYSSTSPHPPLHTSTELAVPVVFFISPRGGPRRQQPASSVASITVAAGKFLLSRCLI
jgi:hypothetical protein